jgi:hypothetical protein
VDVVSAGFQGGRVVFLAKEFSDVSRIIDFILGQTANGGSEGRFNRFVDHRGCSVSAPIEVTGHWRSFGVWGCFSTGDDVEGDFRGKDCPNVAYP